MSRREKLRLFLAGVSLAAALWGYLPDGFGRWVAGLWVGRRWRRSGELEAVGRTSAPSDYVIAEHSRADDDHRMCAWHTVKDPSAGCGQFRDAFVHTRRARADAWPGAHAFVPGELAPAANAVITPCNARMPDEMRQEVASLAPPLPCVLPLWHPGHHDDGMYSWSPITPSPAAADDENDPAGWPWNFSAGNNEEDDRG